MSLVSVVVILIVVGVLLWLMEKYIPMDPTISGSSSLWWSSLLSCGC